MLSHTGYFTAEHFTDPDGWPLGLIVFGLAMIGLSTIAMRIDGRYVHK